MTPTEIQKSLIAWFRAQSLEVEIVGETEINVPIYGKYGNWPCIIFCEADPLTIVYLARLPGTIPETTLAANALSLHDFNRKIRFGRYSVDSKERKITFRYTHKVMPDIPLDLQFNEAMQIVDHQMKTLGQLFILIIKRETEDAEKSMI